MVHGKLSFFLFLFNAFFVTNKVYSLYIIELFILFLDSIYLYIGFISNFVINLMVKRYMTSSSVSVRLIQSMISNLSLYESHTKSKDSSEEAVSNKKRCDREKTSVLDLLYNECDFFYVEFCLFKIVMFFIDCYFAVDVV